MNSANNMHFWWTPEFVSVELFKVQKYCKTRTAKPKVLENFKRSWKKPCNLKRLKEYEPCRRVLVIYQQLDNGKFIHEPMTTVLKKAIA